MTRTEKLRRNTAQSKDSTSSIKVKDKKKRNAPIKGAARLPWESKADFLAEGWVLTIRPLCEVYAAESPETDDSDCMSCSYHCGCPATGWYQVHLPESGKEGNDG